MTGPCQSQYTSSSLRAKIVIRRLNNALRTKMTNQSRRRGAQPGNQNAVKHGRRSAQAILGRKLSRARLKAAAHLGLACGLFNPSCLPKPRPMRMDQMRLLRAYDPELAASLTAISTDQSF